MITFGRITSMLVMKKIYFDKPRWQWERKHYGNMMLNPNYRMNPHIVVVGESGSGKSNACMGLARQLAAAGERVAILDPHDEYSGLADEINARIYDAAYNGINAFELDGASERERASELTGMLKRIFRLGEVQGYHLYKAIMYTYARLYGTERAQNIHDLLYSISLLKKKAGTADSRILDGLSRRLLLLDTGNVSHSADMDGVMNGNSIFVLSGLHTNEAQSVYIESFLRKIYRRMLQMDKRPKSRFYVIIDEAEKLGQKSIAGKIAAEGRKYGIGIIAVSQRIKSIDKDIRTNASLIAAFYQREPEDLNYLANLVSGGNELNRFIEIKKALRGLRTGEAVICESGMRNPVITLFGNGAPKKPCLTYEIARRCMLAANADEICVAMNGLGFGKEDTVKRLDSMEKEGSLQSHVVDAESEYDGKWYMSMPRNSPEHDVCVGLVSRQLKRLGIDSRIYNNSYGPDLVAHYGREKIAFEYETGSKDIEKTASMLKFRLNVYPRVTVIVNNAHFQRYFNALNIENVRVMGLSEFLKAKGMHELLYMKNV